VEEELPPDPLVGFANEYNTVVEDSFGYFKITFPLLNVKTPTSLTVTGWSAPLSDHTSVTVLTLMSLGELFGSRP
jgi:hypothetical protein